MNNHTHDDEFKGLDDVDYIDGDAPDPLGDPIASAPYIHLLSFRYIYQIHSSLSTTRRITLTAATLRDPSSGSGCAENSTAAHAHEGQAVVSRQEMALPVARRGREVTRLTPPDDA